jgi:AraC-like DNA-binding protein/quercetin dioxygenase-like cupin family protein
VLLRKDDLALDTDFPFSIGIVELTDRQDMREIRHWHDCLEITCVRSGRADYFVDGKTYGMGPGDIIIFNNIEPHGWAIDRDAPLSATVAVFMPGLIAGQASLFDYGYLRPFFERGANFRNRLASGDEAVARLFSLVEETRLEYVAERPGYRLMIKAMILQALTLLERHYRRGEEPGESLEARRRSLARIGEALDFMQQGFGEAISLEDVARKALMSPHYFSTYFKKATGATFIEYLSRLRVGRARELLRGTDRKLLDIAQDCGFNNMSNFYRAYRRAFGATPAAERR